MKNRNDYCDDCNSTCDECQYNTVTSGNVNKICANCDNYEALDGECGNCRLLNAKVLRYGGYNYGCNDFRYDEYTDNYSEQDREMRMRAVCENVRKLEHEAKADKGKLQIRLVPTRIIEDIAEVRMYGNKKYGSADNWKQVEMERYVDALMRHTLAFLRDRESVDEESGIPHYKHMACNMAFICEMMRKGEVE